jgi:hypothetical protein
LPWRFGCKPQGAIATSADLLLLLPFLYLGIRALRRPVRSPV